MPPAELGVLAATALATAALSGLVGMGGGIALLAVMLFYLDPLVAIPVHGAIQLVSNASRTAIQRRHVAGAIALRFSILLLPAGALGYTVARGIPPDALRLAIGVFVLLATWAPRVILLGARPERLHPTRRFTWLGGASGFLNVTVGATGPLIAPFYLNLGLSRQAIVGTKAMCQTLGHVAKLIVFGAAGFAFGEHLPAIAVLALFTVAGTWLGSQLLERLDERGFAWLYKGVLTVVAVRLVVADGLAWL